METVVEEDNSKSSVILPSWTTILTILVMVLLIYALFSGKTYKFYASFLFLFYSWIKQMWISVVCLGIFQVLLMMPIRIINLRESANIKDFEERVRKMESESDQYFLLKQNFREGNPAVLWYMVSFFIQTISYFSIGRLFLTDFYRYPLKSELLYSFVKYPQYPIKGIFFKIPYLTFGKTFDFGMDRVWVAWIVIILAKIVIDRLVIYYRKLRKKSGEIIDEKSKALNSVKQLVRFTNSYLILLLIISWLIIRNYPLSWEIRIFSGNISHPYPPFNLITAIMTALTVFWLDIPKIKKKIQLAEMKKIDKKIINQTHKYLFKQTLRSAILLGVGAYFITNHIPSAFELSIFTFEIISLLSPLTLDKIILKTA